MTTPRDRSADPFEPLQPTPAERAQETLGYQKLAWYAAPFGSEGVAVLVLAALLSTLRRLLEVGTRLVVSAARSVLEGREIRR